jgi:hypothetical protein
MLHMLEWKHRRIHVILLRPWVRNLYPFEEFANWVSALNLLETVTTDSRSKVELDRPNLSLNSKDFVK